MAREDWNALSARQKTCVVLGGTAQIVLLLAALADICWRSPAEIRGSKRLWTAAAFVNFVGPISYFFFSRRDVREAVRGGGVLRPTSWRDRVR